MDPVARQALVDLSAKIIAACGSAAWNLRQIKDSWENAPEVLKLIGLECETIETTIRMIKEWLEPQSSSSLEDVIVLAAFSAALQDCHDTLKTLEKSTSEVRPNGSSGLHRWNKFKLAVSDRGLRPCLQELRWQAQTSHKVLSVFSLATSERRLRAEEIQKDLAVHNSTAIAGLSRGSIFTIGLTNYLASDRSLEPSSEYTSLSQTSSPSNSTENPPAAGNSLFFWACISFVVLFIALNLPGSFSPASKTLQPVSASTAAKLRHTAPPKQEPVVTPSITSTISTSTTAITGKSQPAQTAESLVSADPDKALLAAALSGSWKDVSRLLEQGARPSARDSKLRTPLHLAAVSGNKETIEILLKYRNTGWFADDNITPLHLAARFGHTAAVKQIAKISGHNWSRERAVAPQAMKIIQAAIGNKFDLQFAAFYARKTFSARELAVIYGHTETALAFPNHGKDDILHALSCACMLGEVQIVERIWQHYRKRWFWHRHGWIRSQLTRPVRWFPAPPLHLAVMSGNRATVAFFLERGLNSRDQSRRSIVGIFTNALPPYSTPAHYAAIVGSTELLLALERRRADLTVLDHLSRTPLSYAVANHCESAVELLVKRKYPGRGTLFSSGVSSQYLGAGHVWPNKNLKASAVTSKRIKKALAEVGLIA